MVLVQLESWTWTLRTLAVLERHKLVFPGRFELLPVPFSPFADFELKMAGLGHVGEGTFGTVV